MVATLQNFEQLGAWQSSQDLAVEVYRTTKRFPEEERFGIVNQLRRAVSSVSANIAEGFGRTSPKEKVQFYSIAYGSLLEVKNFMYLAHRLAYIDDVLLKKLLDQVVKCQKLINGLLRSTRSKNE